MMRISRIARWQSRNYPQCHECAQRGQQWVGKRDCRADDAGCHPYRQDRSERAPMAGTRVDQGVAGHPVSS